MKVWLKKPIVGYRREFDNTIQAWDKPRIHAEAGAVLPVILHNIKPTHYICDSVNYPGEHILVFPNQVAEILHEVDRKEVVEEDDYSEPKSVIELENDLPYSTLQSDDDVMDQ